MSYMPALASFKTDFLSDCFGQFLKRSLVPDQHCLDGLKVSSHRGKFRSLMVSRCDPLNDCM
jgi:hypothetical protein